MIKIIALCPVTKNRRITLPQKVADKLEIKDFDCVTIVENDAGELVLKKVVV